jgi:Ca-activated chloride channel family protein
MYDLFSGDQLVIVGRYRRHGNLKVRLTGDFLGERQEYVYVDELPKETGSGRNVFVERLWATRRIGQIIDEIDLYGEDKELIDELIVLSKRHGILTPYTAYLAEERTDLNDLRRGRTMAQSGLRGLRAEAGKNAFQQRAFKGELKVRNRAATPSDALGLGPYGGASGATPGIRVSGQALSEPAAATGESTAVPVTRSLQRVKQIASKTFFLRAGRYVDAAATQEQIDSAKKIRQFSEEYFDLLADLDEESKVYLAEEVELLVVLGEQAYLIVPPEANE